LEERKIGKAVRTRSRPSAPARRLARDDAGRGRAQPRMALSRDVLPRPEAPAAARGFRVRRRLQADRTILVPAVVGRGLPIVIDLGELTFIDSCGLWLITTIHSGCRQRGISLRLWGGCEHIQQVFEVTGLYDLLPFVSRHPGSAR
jgi:anti-anti-sigma factor